MSSRSAIVLVVLIVAVIAFCFAGVFAAMTGTYHLNLNFGNNTTQDGGLLSNLSTSSSSDSSGSSGSSQVQTYSDSGSSSQSSSSQVETVEDKSPVHTEPTSHDSSGGNGTVN